VKLHKIPHKTLQKVRWDLTPEKVFKACEVKTSERFRHAVAKLRSLGGYFFCVNIYFFKAELLLMFVNNKTLEVSCMGTIEGIPLNLLKKSIKWADKSIPENHLFPVSPELESWLKSEIAKLCKKCGSSGEKKTT
jgi:hypothetical protein